MVTFGSDSHKRTHTLVVVDQNGCQLAERRVAATASGHLEALDWARQWSERQWALENCRHLSRMLERQLLSAGEVVVQVSPKLMGSVRRSGRELGKSDPIDALAVARAALREPHLPVAQLEGREREVKLLVDHREDLVGERTRIQNRLLWHLHELEPGYQVAASGLLRSVVLAEVSRRLENHTGVVAEIACELVVRLAELTQSVPLQRRLCHAQRHGPDSGLVWESESSPAQSRRQPSAQRRPAPHRHYSDPAWRTGVGLRCSSLDHGQHQDGSHTSIAAPDLGRGLPTPSSGPPKAAVNRRSCGRGLT
jgi:transposase